ncbi:hypothetical protein ALT_0571 [Aspergillus lentulus]|uniref:Uncharacterized protein n=1 Tax=Aspergillus lentulus TaxID=293939 RepID=A0AAN6BMG5_ASPLE|nr:uncharacterized protein IFM58399_00445 [Aspergillus lentulus]KAF4164195.1 hypothetical protein CNMCM6936_009480 [Aspergillus lentulus]KAF4177874.1 hypothetical protein CNMCM8060_004974 [Aspergillus lentulus]KAF4187311.1 hypothetical protein CNMCM7927_004255 [Aspergillus lentulus]KAF4198884.1 hypothetical protein CNMCM8694_007490 [Aspergillus lentulus]KAF4203056.1 hypothetical protein CNMCM8927_009207 [Aspergillus lentulus]
MADVRSLLRSELAARKGAPQAGSTGNRVTKKRKVDITDDLTRKKMRPGEKSADSLSPTVHTVQPPSAQAIDEVEDAERREQETAGLELPPDSKASQEQTQAQPEPFLESNTPQAIDEDEWAAFERDVVAPTRVPQAPAAVAAAATISAAPVSAEQLAAQQEAEKGTSIQAREAEIEGEREDAARFLEDEFDEMEQLEERIRRLKHKREELRQKRAKEASEIPQTEGSSSGKTQGEQQIDETKQSDEEENDDDDDDDDVDDDDWDNWRFR